MPDQDANSLSFKLVYYGPAQSGKTTNLLRLHDILSPELKGEVMTMETKDDRTLFFDLLPLGFRAPSGLLIKLRLFTVPGQVAHDGTRKAVLSRADGIVFVADSDRTQETNNGEAFQSMADNCHRVGLDFEHTPLVVQFNKRDLPGAGRPRRGRCTLRWPSPATGSRPPSSPCCGRSTGATTPSSGWPATTASVNKPSLPASWGGHEHLRLRPRMAARRTLRCADAGARRPPAGRAAGCRPGHPRP
jgi:hypothetical protein